MCMVTPTPTMHTMTDPLVGGGCVSLYAAYVTAGPPARGFFISTRNECIKY